jgi:hypothetical protein
MAECKNCEKGAAKCKPCNGTGIDQHMLQGGGKCKICNGSGKVKCGVCNGTGKV